MKLLKFMKKWSNLQLSNDLKKFFSYKFNLLYVRITNKLISTFQIFFFNIFLSYLFVSLPRLLIIINSSNCLHKRISFTIAIKDARRQFFIGHKVLRNNSMAWFSWKETVNREDLALTESRSSVVGSGPRSGPQITTRHAQRGMPLHSRSPIFMIPSSQKTRANFKTVLPTMLIETCESRHDQQRWDNNFWFEKLSCLKGQDS